MRITIISDTHEKHSELNLEPGDLLIHCGDFTNKGNYFKIRDFLDWMVKQPFKYKVFVAGNHEVGLDKGPNREGKLDLIDSFVKMNEGFHYLENSSISIEGLKIYGSPITPEFYSWAFNVRRGAKIAKYWSMIPDDTNILITHGPPMGILDFAENDWGEPERAGCQDLRARIEQLKNLKLSAFGHLHRQGCSSAKLNDKIFVNAAMCDDKHQINRMPITIEL